MSKFQLNLIATLLAAGLMAFGWWAFNIGGVINVVIGVVFFAIGFFILVYLYGDYWPHY
jgi:hypothetical protein